MGNITNINLDKIMMKDFCFVILSLDYQHSCQCLCVMVVMSSTHHLLQIEARCVIGKILAYFPISKMHLSLRYICRE